MKSITIVTLAVPMLGGCQLLDWVGGAPPPAAEVSPVITSSGTAAISPAPAPAPSASDTMLLRGTPALAVESLLERETVRLESRFGDADFRSAQLRALEGDAGAALRVARMYGDGTNGVPRDERAMVLWLKHASLLDNAGASYQLYLYYLARGLDRDALRYERRALRQGYTLPVRLDNRRG